MENTIINNENFKSGFVAILGHPNAGKSTFLNAVLNESVAITSKKPQTTRKNLRGIYNDEDSQIVFIDTPGIHIAKNKLDKYMSKSIDKSLIDIDVALVIIDIMDSENTNYDDIVALIKNVKVKKILVINKIDAFNKKNTENIENATLTENDINKMLDEKNDSIKKYFTNNDINFDFVFKISSLKKKNIENVLQTIKNELNVGMPFYDREYLTDTPTKQIVADIVRQQCLYKLDKEIPHGITVVVEEYKKNKNTKCVNIAAVIICEKESHKKIIIGHKGEMIKQIGIASRISIEKFLQNKVNIKLQVVVKTNWRDEKTMLMNFGFDEKEIL